MLPSDMEIKKREQGRQEMKKLKYFLVYDASSFLETLVFTK